MGEKWTGREERGRERSKGGRRSEEEGKKGRKKENGKKRKIVSQGEGEGKEETEEERTKQPMTKHHRQLRRLIPLLQHRKHLIVVLDSIYDRLPVLLRGHAFRGGFAGFAPFGGVGGGGAGGTAADGGGRERSCVSGRRARGGFGERCGGEK
jgi:hypothetical protein